jgi:signal transduction histidine kinase/ligand-binding sensor domain-containing protein
LSESTILRFRKYFGGELLLAAVLFPCLAAANYQIDILTADDGLPQGTVTSIAQTPDGYLWVGTQNGLARLDGVSFRVFNANNTPCMKNNRVVQLFVDRQGTLWVGAEQGSLVRYADRQFSAYEMPGLGSAFNYARAFCDDTANSLWIVSCEWQLLHFRQGNFDIASTNWNLSSTLPRTVACDSNGIVCVGTDRELAVRRGRKFEAAWNQDNEQNFGAEFLAPARKGGWWVAGHGRLRRFAGNEFVEDRGLYNWTNLPVYGLFEDSRDRLWVATMGAGLFRYDEDGKILRLTTKEGLPTDFVRCVTEDREGNIWAGTEGGGLCRLKPQIFETIGVQRGLSSDQVMSMCEASDGAYWIGMNGSGIDCLRPGGVEHFDVSRGLSNGHVWALVQDREGTIWAGTWGGLFKLDHDRFVNVSDGGRIGGVVLALMQDAEGDLWVGQQAFGMLARIHGSDRSTVRIPGTSASLDVRTLAQDREGALWVGTANDGLFRLHDGKWTHLGRPDGLASDSIWSLRADDDGTVWIGTCGGGLSRWHEGAMRTWTSKNGLLNDVICQILDDRNGNLWLGSYGGVFSISKAELAQSAQSPTQTVQCVGYKKSDGLPSIECQGGFQPSGWRSRDGRLWFPTIKGFAVVNPSEVPKNTVPPIVLTEEVMADGVSQPEHEKNFVQISPGENQLEIHYTATSLTAPEKVRFKYRMENLDKGWFDAGSRRVATYGRLAPGNYAFHVIACNNDGVWSEPGATLAVQMLPFFWQTGWFMSLSTLLLVGIIFAAVRFVVTRRLHLKLERLEREQTVHRERARIAKDIHDDLGASLTEIAILSELAQKPESPAKEVQSDLQKIASKSKTLTQMLDEIVWAVNPHRDTLENFVTYTCSYAEDFLRVAGIQCRLALPPVAPEMSLRSDIRHSLFLVVKESLNNVVKHAEATEVNIQMEMLSSDFLIVIRDDGSGFNPAPPGETRPENADSTDGSGDGIINMRQRVENLGGRFRIVSRPGEGTTVQIDVPIKN